MRSNVRVLLAHSSKSQVVLVEIIGSAEELVGLFDGTTIAVVVHSLVVISISDLI